MTIDEITSIADIQQLVVQGFKDWRRYGEVNGFTRGDLRLFNYTQTAQFAGRWNFFEQVSRGLIIHARTGEIVALPLSKFYNWLEGGRRSDGHIVTVTEKADGSLGILYREEGMYKIATRGAFDSPQAQWATHFLQTYYDLADLPNELTLLFEIIYPGNRIVINYGDREDLVLLAARNRFTGDFLPFFPEVYALGQQYGFTLPQVYQFNNVLDIIAQTGQIDEHQEGWVVEFSDGQRFKFKGDRYRELHRIISNITFKNTLACVASGTIDTMRQQIPEEYYAQVDEWVAQINARVAEMQQTCSAAFAAAPKDTRKEFVLWVQAQHPRLFPYLIALLDGKPLEPLIYKNWDYER